MAEEKLKKKIEYNYWIYMLTYFSVFLLIMKMPRFVEPASPLSLNAIIRLFAMTLLSSGIAWFIGKKYKLHYSTLFVDLRFRRFSLFYSH